MSIPTYEELLKRNRQLLEGEKNKALGDSENIYDTQISDVTGTYKHAIDQAKTDYADEREKNAVRRVLNEKRIAETNSRLGLGDSGVNLMQQTAVELSHANRQGKIDLAYRKTTDDLAQKLAEAVSAIQVNKAAARGSIEQSYEKMAADSAASEYKANVDAETELQKSIIDAQTQALKSSSRSSSRSGSTKSAAKTGLITVNGGKVSREFSGTLQENGISVMDNGDGTITYFDEYTGKKTTLNSNVNPFTKTVNPNTEYGTFKNTPYQPDNVGKNKKLDDASEDHGKITVRGREQKVWKYGNTYYAWSAIHNDYVPIYYENGSWHSDYEI